MKQLFNWKTVLGIILVASSCGLYLLHYLFFHDSHHIFIYMVGDIAFVPVEVLLVTLIIHHVLDRREKNSLMKKMNMLIGAFFSNTGMCLVSYFAELDPEISELREHLKVSNEWCPKKFGEIKAYLKKYNYNVNPEPKDFAAIRDFLKEKNDFLLNLLANPNLLEHESFTDVLWAVSHLTEELTSRKDLLTLPASDYNHLSLDVKRAYKAVTLQWISYMSHLKTDYPYLFSLAMRTNPYDPASDIIVSE